MVRRMDEQVCIVCKCLRSTVGAVDMQRRYIIRMDITAGPPVFVSASEYAGHLVQYIWMPLHMH